MLTGAVSGCHAIVAPQSVANVDAHALPSDPAALLKLCDEWSQKHDRPTLENALLACDRLSTLKPGSPESYAGFWMASRAAFWLADDANESKDRRAWFGRKSADDGAAAVRLNDKGVEGHYYRALGLGYLAQTKTIGALPLVNDVDKEAKAAIAINDKYDGAGPLRLRGMLLMKAPAWPTSVGDPDEGADTLQKAVTLAPEHPLNQLYYGEALVINSKPEEAVPHLKEATRLAALPEWSFMKERLEKEAREQLAKTESKKK